MSDTPKQDEQPETWTGPELEFENGLVPGVPLLLQATKIGGVPVTPPDEEELKPTRGLVEFRASFRAKP